MYLVEVIRALPGPEWVTSVVFNSGFISVTFDPYSNGGRLKCHWTNSEFWTVEVPSVIRFLRRERLIVSLVTDGKRKVNGVGSYNVFVYCTINKTFKVNEVNR